MYCTDVGMDMCYHMLCQITEAQYTAECQPTWSDWGELAVQTVLTVEDSSHCTNYERREHALCSMTHTTHSLRLRTLLLRMEIWSIVEDTQEMKIIDVGDLLSSNLCHVHTQV